MPSRESATQVDTPLTSSDLSGVVSAPPRSRSRRRVSWWRIGGLIVAAALFSLCVYAVLGLAARALAPALHLVK